MNFSNKLKKVAENFLIRTKNILFFVLIVLFFILPKPSESHQMTIWFSVSLVLVTLIFLVWTMVSVYKKKKTPPSTDSEQSESTQPETPKPSMEVVKSSKKSKSVLWGLLVVFVVIGAYYLIPKTSNTLPSLPNINVSELVDSWLSHLAPYILAPLAGLFAFRFSNGVNYNNWFYAGAVAVLAVVVITFWIHPEWVTLIKDPLIGDFSFKALEGQGKYVGNILLAANAILFLFGYKLESIGMCLLLLMLW